jgi:flagellar protein FliJ
MKKFFFRLETVLIIRRTREAELKIELEYTHQKLKQYKQKEQDLQNQIGLLIEEIHAKELVERLNRQETYSPLLEHLETLLREVQYNLLAQQKQLEEQKMRLKHAIQERKIIEKIKEKHYNGWRKRESQSEGALLDEIALKKPYDFK